MSETKNNIKIGDHTSARIELYTVDGTGTPRKMFVPVLLDDISWSSEWACTPSKMTFTVLKEGALNFGMGTKAVLKLNDEIIWTGYVMAKHRTSDVKIECTAYDQLRYLKIKMFKSFEDVQNAGETIKGILKDFEIPVGEFDTLKQATQGDLVFDDKEALEVIDELMAGHATMSLENLVIFDKAGKVCLKKLDNMRVTSQFFTAEEMGDWNYTSSIEDSYNSITIDVLEADAETHDRFLTVEDEANINRWGLLRYVTQSNEEIKAIESKAKSLLKMTNRENRTLKLQHVLGNPEIRGGSLVAVKLNLGDMLLYSWMVVQEVTHTLGQEGYWMDMTVTNEKLGFADPVSPEGVFTVTQPEPEISESGGSNVAVGGSGTTEERIWNFLRANGFSAAAAAGVMGNWERESGNEPNVTEVGGYGGYGLAQWTNTGPGGAARKTNLINWCKSNGKDYTTLEGQLGFFMYEWNQPAYANKLGKSYQKLSSRDEVWTATDRFLTHYEGATVRNEVVAFDVRLSAAYKFFDKWHTYTTIPGTGASTGTGSSSGDGNCTGYMGWPFANGGGYITQNFSWNGYSGHLGMDISTTRAYYGAPVLAVDGGVVASAGWAVSDGTYGNEVNIKHKEGLYTRYAHLYKINVKAGQKVSKGQQIGIEGCTGNVYSTGGGYGTHLHIEVHAGIPNGSRSNPLNYLHRYG